MKTKNLLLILLCFALRSNAQHIEYGAYVKHQQLGEYDATYEFDYYSKSFTYSTDAYNNLTGRVVLQGQFQIEGDSILFEVNTIWFPILSELSRLSLRDLGEELIMQDSTEIIRQRPSNSNFWSLTGNDCMVAVKKVKLDTPKRFSARFFRHVNDEYIEIDGERFYEYRGGDNGVYENPD